MKKQCVSLVCITAVLFLFSNCSNNGLETLNTSQDSQKPGLAKTYNDVVIKYYDAVTSATTKDIATNTTTAYRISASTFMSSPQKIYRFNGTGWDLYKPFTQPKALAVSDKLNTVFALSEANDVYRYDGMKMSWVLLNGVKAKEIAGGPNGIWAISTDNKIYRWSGSWYIHPNQPTFIPGKIAVDVDDQPWITDLSNLQMYKYDGSDWIDKWGQARSMSVGSDGTMMYVGGDYRIYQSNPEQTNWDQVVVVNPATGDTIKHTTPWVDIAVQSRNKFWFMRAYAGRNDKNLLSAKPRP